MSLAALRPHATPRQLAILDAIESEGTQAKAAKKLGITTRNVEAAMQRLRRAAALVDIEQHQYAKGGVVPLGYHIRGISELVPTVDENGEPRGQKWIKTEVDKDFRIQALLDAVQGLADKLPIGDTIAAPPVDVDDLLCVYPMGDPHVGMYAWAAECGDDFDLDIAERQIIAAVDHLVELAPEGTPALVINVGDFFHSDHQGNTTRKSGHQLDVDTRWSRVLAVGVRIMVRLIDRALRRHSVVRVINEIGNHDDHTSLVLAICLEHHYINNPRVTIDTSPAKVHYHRFGACLIGVTHGDTIKAAQLGPIMAVDRARDWGETKHRYWYTGHVHHESAKEFPGVVVETFRTLAPKDAWHAGQGYRSGQDMRLDILHAEDGRVNRHIVGIDRIRSRMKEAA